MNCMFDSAIVTPLEIGHYIVEYSIRNKDIFSIDGSFIIIQYSVVEYTVK